MAGAQYTPWQSVGQAGSQSLRGNFESCSRRTEKKIAPQKPVAPFPSLDSRGWGRPHSPGPHKASCKFGCLQLLLRKERSEVTWLKFQVSDHCPGQQNNQTTASHNYQPPVIKHALSTPMQLSYFALCSFSNSFQAQMSGLGFSTAWRTSAKQQHRNARSHTPTRDPGLQFLQSGFQDTRY